MKKASQCVLCQSIIKADNLGIVVLGKCICIDCEQKITHLAGDDPAYDFYKGGLKKIWFNEA